MKYCIEFGIRGGAHTDNTVLPTQKLAAELASRLVMVFEADPFALAAKQSKWTGKAVRYYWQSKTHFVAISKLDGVPRGPASTALWRKPNDGEFCNSHAVYSQ